MFVLLQFLPRAVKRWSHTVVISLRDQPQIRELRFAALAWPVLSAVTLGMLFKVGLSDSSQLLKERMSVSVSFLVVVK